MILTLAEEETNSPLAILYNDYAERYPINNTLIWEKADALRAVLLKLTVEEQAPVLAAVAQLVEEHERAAFTRGIQTGLRLAEELRD